LITLAGIPTLLFFSKEMRLFAFSYTLTTCTVALFLFVIWGGLVPEHSAQTISPGFSANHAALAFGYCAIVQMILNPAFILDNKRLTTIAISVATTGVWILYFLNGGPGTVTIFGASLIKHIVSGNLAIYLGGFAYGTVIGLGVIFGVHLGQMFSSKWKDEPVQAFILSNIVLLLIATANMGNFFAFKYILPSGILLTLLGENEAITLWRPFRLALGGVAGTLMLGAYLY